MLLSKTRFALICLNFALFCGCSQVYTEYTCPFGVGYLTPRDYETMLDGNLISDEFATWLLQTNMYCEKGIV